MRKNIPRDRGLPRASRAASLGVASHWVRHALRLCVGQRTYAPRVASLYHAQGTGRVRCLCAALCKATAGRRASLGIPLGVTYLCTWVTFLLEHVSRRCVAIGLSVLSKYSTGCVTGCSSVQVVVHT